MARHHPAVVAYDIRCNRRRRRVYRILSDWRLDAQKSVVETRLSVALADELFLQLGEEIDPETDRLALVWIETASARYRGADNPHRTGAGHYFGGRQGTKANSKRSRNHAKA